MATTKVSDLITIASRITRISREQIVGPQRGRGIARVRQAIAYVAAEQGVHSLTKIGHVLNRDHTTIVYARDIVPEYMKRDADLRLLVERLFVEADKFDVSRPTLIEPWPLPTPKLRKVAATKPARVKKGDDEWTRQKWEDGMREGQARLLKALLAA